MGRGDHHPYSTSDNPYFTTSQEQLSFKFFYHIYKHYKYLSLIYLDLKISAVDQVSIDSINTKIKTGIVSFKSQQCKL